MPEHTYVLLAHLTKKPKQNSMLLTLDTQEALTNVYTYFEVLK